jgi:DNA-binding CsgD family transcriptional regulator
MSPRVGGFRLDEAVADVFGDLRLAAVLRRLLGHTRRLTGSVAGSVSVVDAEHGSYVKVAEYGDFCRLGDSFRLDEGATGQAYGERQPVIIADYGRMPTNHLHGRHPGREGPAAAVPIWWRGDVIAVNVAFSGRGGRFTTRNVDDLEALTQSAAAAIIESGRREASPAGGIRRRMTSPQAVVTEAGLVRPVPAELARVAADLVAAAAEAAGGPDGRSGTGPGAETAPVPGTRSEAALVAETVGFSAYGKIAAPFTPRETQVLGFLRRGLTDREIAARLVLSAKTVEKHVGAIMRKTGTTNRTAAVVTALENGW